MLGQKPRTVSTQSSYFCLLGRDEGAQQSFWRSPNTLADLQKALWMCCVILDMFPILTGLDCYRLFSEVYGSDRLLGLPCLLYLIRVSSAIQKTLPFTQTSSTTPRLLHGPPATFLSAMGTPTEAYKGYATGQCTISTPFGLVFKASQSLAPILRHKTCCNTRPRGLEEEERSWIQDRQEDGGSPLPERG